MDMDKQFKLAGLFEVTSQQLANSKFYSDLLSLYGDCGNLPIPEGVSQAAIAAYVHHLAKRQDSRQTMLQSLRLCSLIEDTDWLQQLVIEMLTDWSSLDYSQVIEILDASNPDLLSDILPQLPYLCLPKRLRCDLGFLSRWITTTKSCKFVVDGYTYEQSWYMCRETAKLTSLYCTATGNRDAICYSLHWQDDGSLRQFTKFTGYPMGLEEVEQFYPSGVMECKFARRQNVAVGDSWHYHANGKDRLHIERDKTGKTIRRTEWNDEGKVTKQLFGSALTADY